MKFLDLTGLQYFYEKYLRPLKNAAFKDVANDLTTSIDGFVLDARQGTVLDEKKLDKSKVINNALTTEEGFALDARQGKVLKDEIDELNGKMSLMYGVGALFQVRAKPDNLIYGAYAPGIYYFDGSAQGVPVSGHNGAMLTFRESETSNMIKIAFTTDGSINRMVQRSNGEVAQGWRSVW